MLKTTQLRLTEAPIAAEARKPAEIEILPPGDALETIRGVPQPVRTTILDPWYNKGVGGVRNDYDEWLNELVHSASEISEHVFVWGFPENLAPLLGHMPKKFELVAWLTWYYKNCPSVIRGWRSAQNACLHLARQGATLYPEHFLNEAQHRLRDERKLRYMPGPPSVIEVPLNIGFVGKNEQTGHPSQKPTKVFEPLILMTTVPGDWVLDPTAGSGTTGVVCQQLRRNAVLSDLSEEYTQLMEKRMGQRRRRHRYRLNRRSTRAETGTLVVCPSRTRPVRSRTR